MDPDQVYMATKLAGEGTFFLPFNRGSQGGAGNPDHPSGYRTGYLWQEVWRRDSFLDILGRFAHLAVEETKVEGKTVTKETVVFPRYHQLDAVRKLEAAARADGAGNSYLVQHSAGSGKSNSRIVTDSTMFGNYTSALWENAGGQWHQIWASGVTGFSASPANADTVYVNVNGTLYEHVGRGQSSCRGRKS